MAVATEPANPDLLPLEIFRLLYLAPSQDTLG
jgi:hypothetical protein